LNTEVKLHSFPAQTGEIAVEQ